MPQDRGVGQYLPEEVATNSRARYESHHTLEINDYLYGGTLSGGSLVRDLPAGSSTDILFQNFSDNDSYYDVKPFYISNGRCIAQKHVNVTVNSQGTPVPTGQQRSDFINNTGNLAVTTGADTDYTGARNFPERLLSVARDQGAQVRAESVLIAPGDNLDIEIRNIGNQPADTTIYLRISPIPVTLIETLSDGPEE